ncbi:carboxypeptidase Y inhibitor [Rhodotorula kratochvilovae]
MTTSFTGTQIDQALQDAGLIGSTVIPSTFKNKVVVHVTYGGSVGSVQAGATYAVADTQGEPSISFNAPPGKDSRFTVVLADPDAPSREDPKWGPFLHFVLGDVLPGQAVGQTIVSYMGPAPPQGSGPHRYVFNVYAQPVDHTPTLPGEPDARQSFPLSKFVADNELELVGSTFFYAENK